MAMAFTTRFAAAALLLSGCNLPSAALLAAGQGDDAQSLLGLEVRFQPGVPLINAAAEAPAAFSRLRGAASRIDFAQLSLGEASTILEGELLQKGMLLPLPAGVLTIRTIAPEAQPIEAVAVTVAITESAAIAEDRRQLPEMVGAYTAGARTMMLSTDGSFVLSGPAQPLVRGTFFLVGTKLELAEKSGEKLMFAPVSDGWRDAAGRTYILIHEAPSGGGHSGRHGRGGR